MPTIKFSHHYPKLHGQTSAELLAVRTCTRDEMSAAFIEYDTAYEGEAGVVGPTMYYPLPRNKYMVLYFIGNERIPFTTVRRWTPEKCTYYYEAVGQTFDIVHVEAKV